MKYHCQYVNNARWSYVLFYVWIVFTPSRQYFSLNKQLSVVKFWSFFGGPCKPIFHRNRSFACKGGEIIIRWYLINITEWPFRFYFMDIFQVIHFIQMCKQGSASQGVCTQFVDIKRNDKLMCYVFSCVCRVN